MSNHQHGSNDKIALILSGFPRRSETFALNEATALSKRGLLAGIYATKEGDGLPPHPDSEALLSQITYLPDGKSQQQAAALIADLQSNQNGDKVKGIHGYFAHRPAEIAEMAATNMGISYGFSVHAKDARKVSPDELTRRADGATCVVACNKDVATEFKYTTRPVDILRHGVDCQRFFPQDGPSETRLELLAVGRLVEKKGFDLLIAAAKQIRIPFRLRIIGDGPLRQSLTEQIQGFGLEDLIELHPGMNHDQLPDVYAASHMVIVPSVVDQSGDRDGLPNVVLEAMACGRPVIASDVAAISTAVKHEQTGLLVFPQETLGLASAIEKLWSDPQMRQRIGENSRQLIESDFDLRQCSQRFCDYIVSKYGLVSN